MGQDYFSQAMGAMDRGYYNQLDSFGTVYHPTALHEDPSGAKTALGPREIGQSANPFMNQLQSLQARIRAGASSVEITFGGVGKGNNQQGTPEMYGSMEREAMRQLAEYNDVKTSTHASFGMSGLAGFTREGFNKQAQHQNMEEVRKAVDFASQATTGGAIVVHTGEWQRPISEQEWATKDFGKYFKDSNSPNIRAYADEPEKASAYVVDDRTGEIIGGIRKDMELFEPKWVRASEYKKLKGKDVTGKDPDGNIVKNWSGDDYVDVDGNIINPENPDHLFRRLPHWDEENTRFKSEKLEWKDISKKTKEYNSKYNTKYTPEEMFARIQIDNQALQARGNSLFHAQQYDHLMKTRERLEKALALANELYGSLPPDQAWRALRSEGSVSDLIPPEQKDVREQLKEQIRESEQRMRHIHESSSSADVQAETLLERKKRIRTMEDYGLEQTGQALGELGMYAMQKTNEMKTRVKKEGGDASKYENLYIAPENVFTQEYGSHPDELIKIVQAGREKMAKEIQFKFHKTADEAKKIAAEHIKSTIDIGHLNMWKTHLQRIEGETEDQFNKRFEKWTLDKLEKMHKAGVLGHFHITDNWGFNDEHLTPGQGNAPVRSFVQKLEKLGYKDFIVEQSGTNDGTILGESWSYFGVNGFKPSMQGQFAGRFTDKHWHHAGSYAPPNYIVGSYSPSNDWTLWSGTPLE